MLDINVDRAVVDAFYDERTGSVTYIVSDPKTRKCAIIDPLLDFSETSARISTASADRLLAFIEENDFALEWILDTHAHADHLSAAAYLKEKTDSPIAIGRRIVDVQKIWAGIYNLKDFPSDGSQWDTLFDESDSFTIGSLTVSVLHSPGHTPASITYVVGDAAFIHDTLFQPDSGTARADFPGGSAEQLYQSIQRILRLPGETRLYTGHDYRPGGRPAQWLSTVAEQRSSNIHICGYPSREAYVAMRIERDRRLELPRLMLHALQFNIRGGRLPEIEGNGSAYFKIPVNVF